MMKKIVNKIYYILKSNFRKIFFYLRFIKNKKKGHWTVKNFYDYQDYINFQKEKTLDKKKRFKWLNDEWDEKVNYFNNIFKNLFNEINLDTQSKCLCIGARTGQEVHALRNLGFSAIGIDIVECEPLVEIGDMHNLKYSDNSFDFIFSNILDHSLYPDKSINEIERVLKNNGYAFLQITIGEATDKYGVTEIKSEKDIIKLFKKSEIIFNRSIEHYSIAQNWEILSKKHY
jgi:SAM-dependent methyltransferase